MWYGNCLLSTLAYRVYGKNITQQERKTQKINEKNGKSHKNHIEVPNNLEETSRTTIEIQFNEKGPENSGTPKRHQTKWREKEIVAATATIQEYTIQENISLHQTVEHIKI